MSAAGELIRAVTMTSIVLFVTGCSSGSETLADATSEEPSAVAATEAAYASPTAATTTVSDYLAAKISVHRNVSEWLEDWDEYGCSALIADIDISCGLQLVTAGMISDTVMLVLEGAQKPGVPAYIGPPPRELEAVIDSTLSSAESVKETSEQWQSLECPGSSLCANRALFTEMAMTELQDSLDAWELYR